MMNILSGSAWADIPSALFEERIPPGWPFVGAIATGSVKTQGDFSMLKRLLVLCLLPALLGCGARVEVAKDKILAQVDSLLGEIDVKKKEAEIGVRNLTAAMEQYTRGKIKAKVKLKQVSGRLDELEKKVADADKFLGRLRDYLKAGKNVEISGKTYTPGATEGDGRGCHPPP